MDEIDAINGYAAVILGSAIHNMAWLPQATSFVETQRAELAARPVWLFSVSSVGDTSSFFGPRAGIACIRLAIRPRDHRTFVGVVERSHWNLGGHLFLKAFGGSYGDHRDWHDIDAWADDIARQLLAVDHG